MKLYFIRTILLSLFFCSCDLSPGSYPYAEVYEFDGIKEETLIEAVELFKYENPTYAVPKGLGLIDGRDESKIDHWYHLWFNYSGENQILYAWIRGDKFAFVSINQGTSLGNWKSINQDFDDSRNRKEKEKFERLILNEIKKYIPSGEE